MLLHVPRDERTERYDLVAARAHQLQRARDQRRSNACAAQRGRHFGMCHDDVAAIAQIIDEGQAAACRFELVTVVFGVVATVAIIGPPNR